MRVRSIFRLIPFFTLVVAVQGIHVIEHVIQLAQVYAFGVADDDAFGLLGYLINPNDTEEWLHLGFNALYLLALFALALPLWRRVGGGLPLAGFLAFAIAGVGLESWHMVEHIVIISHVIANGGCPCPGIGDRVLGVTDTQLHFVYNAIAFTGTLVGFWYVVRPNADGRAARRWAISS